MEKVSEKPPPYEQTASPGNPVGQTPGHLTGQVPGQTVGQIPGYPTGQVPGLPAGQTFVNAIGQHPGYASSQTLGKPSGQAVVYTSSQTLGNPSGQAVVYTGSQGSGYPGVQNLGYAVGPEQVVMTQPQHVGNTTVIIQQPAVPSRPPVKGWNTGLCGCFEDAGICLCGICCPCCLLCQVAIDMGETCWTPLCVHNSVMALRIKWRSEHGIEGSILNDCCTDCWCSLCALCQLAREVKLEKQQR